MQPFIIYHGNCSDGLAAATVAYLVHGDQALYFEANYREPPPAIEDLAGRDVIMMDFAYDLPTMQAISEHAASLTVLDHHATAVKTLSAFKPVCCGKVHFDMNHSGAMLAWKHFNPGIEAPYLIRAVESRDIWRWDVPGDKPFLRWLDTEPRTRERWAQIMAFAPKEIEAAIREGKAMSRFFDSQVNSHKKHHEISIDGVKGVMVNTSPIFTSELGNKLSSETGTFALIWHAGPKGIACSLRSQPGFSVREIAERFGGGGHDCAAAFSLPLDRFAELMSGELVATNQHDSKERATVRPTN